ncbi:MAG: Sb-PDE family phosphodiesterase [Pirellulaceae bacterium]
MDNLQPFWARQLSRAVILAIICAAAEFAVSQEPRYEISFPDPAGFQTVTCDLHMHTVFSDGLVWPNVRIGEAWRQGLDVVSITDHVEYQPHKDDVKTNHNRPFELVKDLARMLDLMLIRGTEITRDTPPGHFNAIFLEDVNKLDTPEFLDAIKAANDQGAFVFWNHQGWQGEEKGSWQEVHTTMLDNKMFQGMEVCNGGTYYPTAHKWCLDKNLTMLGNSDIHDPDLRKQSTADDHRTMTLVFVTEKTPAALKEALLAGRTAVWYTDQLIGRREHLEPLFHGAVQIQTPIVRSGKSVWLQIHNSCSAEIKLVRLTGNGPDSITLPAQATTLVRFSTAADDTPLDLQYTAANFLIAPETGLPVVLNAAAQP